MFSSGGSITTAPLEVELKLELPAAALPQFGKLPLIRALEASAKRSSQVSVYFDSDRQKLRRHDLTLRVRRIGDRTYRRSRRRRIPTS
jgi:inorganic triphosphatase YgiF